MKFSELHDELIMNEATYGKELIGKEIFYGSPGYPMEIEITNISKSNNGIDVDYKLEGEEGHYFKILLKDFKKFQKKGFVRWTDPITSGYSVLALDLDLYDS
jgi:hypothetical protein